MTEDRIVYWCGKPVDEMTREELIEALNALARLLRTEQAEHARQLDVLMR